MSLEQLWITIVSELERFLIWIGETPVRLWEALIGIWQWLVWLWEAFPGLWELTISGVMIAPYVFPRTVAIMPRLNLKPFVECVFPLDKAHDAMVMQLTGKYPKVLVECNPGLE